MTEPVLHLSLPVTDLAAARSFYEVLRNEAEYNRVVDRLQQHGVAWLQEPSIHSAAELSGKLGGKLADPSGNVIEVKYYPDKEAYLANER